jgi:hypothetical protein
MKDFRMLLVSEELFKPNLVLILKFDYFFILFYSLKGTVPCCYSCANGQGMENTKHRQFIYRPDGKLLRYINFYCKLNEYLVQNKSSGSKQVFLPITF